jgi:hypothetical protein
VLTSLSTAPGSDGPVEAGGPAATTVATSEGTGATVGAPESRAAVGSGALAIGGAAKGTTELGTVRTEVALLKYAAAGPLVGTEVTCAPFEKYAAVNRAISSGLA